ncbi:hypothetical protein EI94DRAFT_1707682 [Lactarius quietus]|nr:hypothetical protein EI94DRAFT_1707682 [Lactarius quietus]
MSENLAATPHAKNETIAAESRAPTTQNSYFIFFPSSSRAILVAFTRERSFIPTLTLELPSMQSVKTFMGEVGRSCTWNGETPESFVVSTTLRSRKTPTCGHLKLDEPYMMYRDWREKTKALLAHGESTKLPKNKMARPGTKVYVRWATEEMKTYPKLFDGYTKGEGIIATPERFLRWFGSREC